MLYETGLLRQALFLGDNMTEEETERRRPEFNVKLCDERHKFIQETLTALNMKMTGFYILAISTLALSK